MPFSRMGKPPVVPPQIIKAMKLLTLFLTVLLLQVSAHSTAQQVNYSVKEGKLKDAFDNLEKQTGMVFFYKSDLLNTAKTVTVDIKNLPITKALDQLLKDQPLEYTVEGNTVFIKPKKAQSSATATVIIENVNAAIDVHGVVKDESGKPVIGASVLVKGTNKGTTTNEQGEFNLYAVDEKATLVISAINIETLEILVSGRKEISLVAKTKISKLEDVEITAVNTGYQNVPKERITGSFVQLNNELVNRKVGSNILDRLDGIASGVYFNGSSLAGNGVFLSNPTTNGVGSNNLSGINIRGMSTLPANGPLVGSDPLIVVDNFPYVGDMRNINPNDVESITILKDAAAASIWGARAGNGVIVITTKKGKLNQKVKIELNSNINISNKPDLFYDKNFLKSSDYIDVEQYLYSQGYFNADISNTTNRPALSPVVEILANQTAGLISSSDAATQINSLRNLDVRNDIMKYIYQKAITQQYSVGLRGGGNNMSYSLSFGFDNNKNALVRNGQNRTTINANNIYTPIKNLEISTAINYSQSNVSTSNTLGFPSSMAVGGKFGGLPYAQLADAQGNALAIAHVYRAAYVDSVQKLGFLDWHYRPLDEINNADFTSKINDLLLRVSTKYQFTTSLSGELLYQNEHELLSSRNFQSVQTFYSRNLINQFTLYTPATKSFTYQFPIGGVLNLQNYEVNSNNTRGQLNFNKTFHSKHTINAIAGTELREIVTTGYLPTYIGYDDKYGTSVSNLNYNTSYNVNPSGSTTLGNAVSPPNGNTSKTTYRFISYFTNAAYTYNSLYTATVSGREEGSNIFGAKTNNKITPLWSAGLAWNVSNAAFYHLTFLPNLKFRTSYGYSGNVYNGSAYSTGVYLPSSLTGAQYINGLTTPNPDLSWEKVKNINFGLDFATKGSVFSGTIEYYQKYGLDLIESAPLAASTGFSSFIGNAANTKTKGFDITLNVRNIDKKLKWYTTLLISTLNDKVTKYDLAQTSTSIQSFQGVALLGKPLFSIFSYKWAGLDPLTGDPQGYLNGKVSNNYTSIINNFSPDSLIFNGSARPVVYGSFRNDFSYKGFSLSFNITYKFGYYFRRPSISLNYQDLIGSYGNSDYSQRWQKTGDEKTTNVPSLVYPSNTNRNTFYQYSEVLVEKGDHIRLQDIRIGYNIDKHTWKNMPFEGIQLYTYASNLGILWRANKYGIDPDAAPPVLGSHLLPNPLSIAFGIKITY